MKRVLFFLGFLSLATITYAQAATSNNKFVWDQIAPDTPTANSYTYKYYPDSGSVATTFSGVVCSGTASPFTCTVNIPAFTPGNHSVTITASNAAGESPKSAPINFTFTVIPATPTNIRIQ